MYIQLHDGLNIHLYNFPAIYIYNYLNKQLLHQKKRNLVSIGLWYMASIQNIMYHLSHYQGWKFRYYQVWTIIILSSTTLEGPLKSSYM